MDALFFYQYDSPAVGFPQRGGSGRVAVSLIIHCFLCLPWYKNYQEGGLSEVHFLNISYVILTDTISTTAPTKP